MELSSVSHNESHAPSRTICPGENADLGHALKQQIMECFEESIQAMRREHKNIENWTSSLRHEIQKGKGEILVSCHRMELDIAQCRGLLNDVMNKSCNQSEGWQSEAVDGPSPQTVGEQTLVRFSGAPLPATGGKSGSGITQNTETVATSTQAISHVTGHSRTASSILTQILRKIEFRERKHKQAKMFVESHCKCYRSQCAPSLLVWFIHSIAFNNFCALITIAFAVVVGVEADLQIKAALSDQNFPSWLSPVVNCFNVWFVAEISLRMFTDGIRHFLDSDSWRWNVFDLGIAILSLVDMFAHTGSFAFLRLLRALKVVKAFRVVRLLTAFRDLRLLIASMLTSLMSLIWSMVFLVMVIYLAAVTIVQAAAVYVKDNENATREPIQKMYRSLSQAMYVLLMCITGGMDWSEAASLVWHFGWVYGGAFIFYILFCLLGILNVITSIFVEHAANMKKFDSDYAVSEELRAMEEEIEATVALFETLIPDGDHEIDITHLEEILKNTRVVAHFAAIGIEISDRSFMSHTLKETAGGLVDTKAFVRGCLALRGVAKQSDTQSIILHVKKLGAVVEEMMEDTAQKFKVLAKLAAKSGHPGRDDKHVECDGWGPSGRGNDDVVVMPPLPESNLLESDPLISL